MFYPPFSSSVPAGPELERCSVYLTLGHNATYFAWGASECVWRAESAVSWSHSRCYSVWLLQKMYLVGGTGYYGKIASTADNCPVTVQNAQQDILDIERRLAGLKRYGRRDIIWSLVGCVYAPLTPMDQSSLIRSCQPVEMPRAAESSVSTVSALRTGGSCIRSKICVSRIV